ncbi:MAG: O-methyltransferase, partial [Deltaproteobacteria bacterium]
MSQTRWEAVDSYLVDTFVPRDEALAAALAASEAAGLPEIQVTPTQGRLLEMLARALGARRILEIGTLGGYSTLWMARGLASGGRLVTLEYEPRHAEVARANFARAGRSSAIDLRVGAALDLLPRLEQEQAGPFDLVFVDADKVNLPEYFTWSVRLSRPGTLIVIDNVIRDGEVVDPESPDAAVQGVRRMNVRIAAEPRVSATALQTVGGKG